MRYAIHTLLARTTHAQQNYLRPYLKQLGLSPGQPKVLRYLAALGPSSQRALADYCGVDPSAICRTLDSMERDGFLIRKPSPSDRRSGRKKGRVPWRSGRNNVWSSSGRCSRASPRRSRPS